MNWGISINSLNLVDSKPYFEQHMWGENCTVYAPITTITVYVKMSDLFCVGLGTCLEDLGVFQVQKQVYVTGVDAESVDRWTKRQDVAFCNPSKQWWKQWESQSMTNHLHNYHYESFQKQTLCVCFFSAHLEKTLRKPLAEVEPASLGPSFHFLQVHIAPQRTASVHSPGEQRMDGVWIYRQNVHYWKGFTSSC